MQCHRIDELLELLKNEWIGHKNDSLMIFLTKIADEAGHQDDLKNMNDDMLIYHLKMRSLTEADMIPGIAKDCEDDFKAATLKARGLSS